MNVYDKFVNKTSSIKMQSKEKSNNWHCHFRWIDKLFSHYLNFEINKAPPVAERFSARNWQTGSAMFNPRSRLSTQPFGVFRSYLRNSHKYIIGSLRKTSTEDTPPKGPGPTCGKLALTQHSSLKDVHGGILFFML